MRRGLLYLGTENAIYVSFDDGENWQPLQNDLPHAPVSGIVVQEHFNDLVIATYGRGFWILDDITPLRQLTPEVLRRRRAPVPAAAGVPLPRRSPRRPRTYDDPTVGENPQYGAAINYYLKQARAGRRHADDQRQPGRRWCARCTVPGGAGLNRVYWDLRGDADQGGAVADQPAVRPRAAARRGRDAAAGGGGGADDDARAAGHLHGEAVDRRARLHPAAHGPQGSALRRHRGRHPGADDGADASCASGINTAVDAINQLEYVRAQVQTIMRIARRTAS